MSNYIKRDDLLIYILQMPSEVFSSEVVVVHCKDCRNHECVSQCTLNSGTWLDKDYCSKGKRKDNNV